MAGPHQSSLSASQPERNPRRHAFGYSGARPAIGVIVLGTLAAAPASAQTPALAADLASCPGYTVCPVVDYQEAITNDPDI
jgi:hypothetical protein